MRKVILIAIAALLLGSQITFAQMRIVGSISGVVTDPTGAAVPNAKVTLKDEVNGTRKEAPTNNSGQFSFPDLPFGSFSVTVVAAGFENAVVDHISVVASQTTDVPVHMKVGTAQETVTVEGTTLRLTVERGDQALPGLLRALDGAGIGLASIALHRPTLDDVFLTLTGRSLRDEPTDAKAND